MRSPPSRTHCSPYSPNRQAKRLLSSTICERYKFRTNFSFFMISIQKITNLHSKFDISSKNRSKFLKIFAYTFRNLTKLQKSPYNVDKTPPVFAWLKTWVNAFGFNMNFRVIDDFCKSISEIRSKYRSEIDTVPAIFLRIWTLLGTWNHILPRVRRLRCGRESTISNDFFADFDQNRSVDCVEFSENLTENGNYVRK